MAQISDFFAEWPEKYDEWFETPIGKLVKEYEGRLLLGAASPGRGKRSWMWDAGPASSPSTCWLPDRR